VVDVMRGIRVVEVADYIFVPAAAGLLADWGADVIKVEHHVLGDLMRGLTTHHPGQPAVPAFHPGMEAANRRKRSLGLNLASEGGREVLYALVRSADVFLTSKLTPTRQKLKFDVDDLRAVNPSLIYVRGTGHGAKGEEAEAGGFDALDFWYRTGIAMGAKAREVDAPPFMPSGAFGDNTGGMYIAGGISAALLHRERTGQALTVDVSLLAAGMWSLSTGIALSGLYGTPVQQRPVESSLGPMVTTYKTSDARFIAMNCLQGHRYFPDLGRVLGLGAELADDPRFATAEEFGRNGEDVRALLTTAFGKLTFKEAIGLLADFSGQWGPVQASDQVAEDRQVIANDLIGEMTTSTGHPLRAVRPPVQFDEAPAELGRSPQFNQHCEEILAELGYDAAKIIDLKVAGAVS
jgi:crotonobetainyl-CoA:carnitine CoA-transferase CaiB-like acyl-CoA transferase